MLATEQPVRQRQRQRRGPEVANPDPALRKPQAAEYLGISVRTLERYTKRGLLKSVRLGPQICAWRRSELERFLDPKAP